MAAKRKPSMRHCTEWVVVQRRKCGRWASGPKKRVYRRKEGPRKTRKDKGHKRGPRVKGMVVETSSPKRKTMGKSEAKRVATALNALRGTKGVIVAGSSTLKTTSTRPLRTIQSARFKGTKK